MRASLPYPGAPPSSSVPRSAGTGSALLGHMHMASSGGLCGGSQLHDDERRLRVAGNWSPIPASMCYG